MTDSYTWEWLSDQVALETMHRPMKVEDAEALEAALPAHRAGGPAGKPWGLVVDVRSAGVLDVAVQEVIKRVMRKGAELGCTAVAMVNTKVVVELQTRRLSSEVEQAPFLMFDSVDEAVASLARQLAAVA